MGSIRPQAPAILRPRWISREDIAAERPAPLAHGWQCALADEALTWSNGVFELFGIPAGTRIDRREALAMYADTSRATLERVRAQVIAQCGSFTLEAQIFRADGAERWVRITADVARGAGGQPALLYGTKQDISDDVAAGHVPFLGPLA
jgi:PAS domain-containing protein